jgi:alkanesulfonate monooxygenase SsuD/methylene tetrahydromethanopterin reductase-like flavin-dependent oxidoreductase (luciferase family)
MQLKFGYKASAEQFSPRELVEYAVLAEHVGLDSVVISDHFQAWRHNGGHAPFSLSWLAAVGERTERVQLGTSVMTPTFRYNPAVIAQAFATLACLYPDRVMIGIGTGEALNEVAVARLEWPEFKERFARMREAVELMRALWTGERVTFGTAPTTKPPTPLCTTARTSPCRSTSRPAARWWPATPDGPETASSAPPARAPSSTSKTFSPPSTKASRRPDGPRTTSTA